METTNIKSILIEEFSQDPIYRLSILNGLEPYLFTGGILSLHKDLQYSTVEAGRIIERSDSTIRNHFRSELIEYIAPERFGKYYRLSYASIFRLHMIFLLMEKSQKTTIDLLAELGMQPTTVIGGNIKRVARASHVTNRELMNGDEVLEEDHVVNERFEKLEHAIGIQGIMLNILKYEKDIAEFDRKIDNNRSAITQTTAEKRMKFLEEKQSRLLTSSIKKTQKKQSFLGLFKKSEDIEIEKIDSEISSKLKEKYDKEILEAIEIYQSEISKLEEEKQKIIHSLEQEKNAFSKLQLTNTVKLGISENKD